MPSLEAVTDGAHEQRAHAHETLEIPGGSHAITVSHPKAVARQIMEAAAVHAAA